MTDTRAPLVGMTGDRALSTRFVDEKTHERMCSDCLTVGQHTPVYDDGQLRLRCAACLAFKTRRKS